jgi:hypothetical protein
MKHRSPIAVFLLGFFTLGLYSWYWAVKTKGEMNKLGEQIPTAWIWLIPIVGSIWWLWKYSEGVEHVTNKSLNQVLAFVVLFIIGAIGQAIVQDSFNNVGATAPANPGHTPFTSPPTSYAEPIQSEPVNPVPPNIQPPNPPIVG